MVDSNYTLSLFPTKNVNIIIPKSCEYATLPSKRDFAGIIKNLETVCVCGGVIWNICVGPIVTGSAKREAEEESRL